MAEHPTQDELQDFFAGGLPPARFCAVVAHLLRGCVTCNAALPPEAELLLGMAPTAPQETPRYDEALDRAFAAQRWHGLEALKQRAMAREALMRIKAGGIEGLAEAPSKLKGIPGCEALLEESWALRHENPQKMLELANYAVLAASKLNPVLHGARRLADLQCRAWSALGNAYRVADDLDSSEWALGRAAELHLKGTGDEILAARLLDLQASLCGAQRRFPAAMEALDAVYSLHRRRGDDHLAGRALLKKGIYTGHANNPEGAVRLLTEALSLIGQERDPQLTLSAIHNIAAFLVDCGRFRQARALVWENRWRYDQHGGRIDRVKLRWLQGLIDAGMENTTSAEQALVEARQGLDEAGLRYHSALSGLDLASILLRQKRGGEARDMVLASTGVFLELRIQREAMGAVLMLRQTFEAGVEAKVLLDQVILFLRRLEHDPTLTFSAWFL